MDADRLARASQRARAHGLFANATDVHVAQASGRLDVMGGIADYSGSLVLPLPLAVSALALAAPRRDDTVRVVSVGNDGEPDRAVELALPRLLADEYESLAHALREAAAPWAAYLVGIVPVLHRERGLRAGAGFDLLVASDVPEGKGVSSSAAVEVACATALVAALPFTRGDGAQATPFAGPARAARRELALLCQIVENRVAGAACGVMDQMSAACGRAGELLRLLCQPAEIEGHVAVPPGFAFWGIDSGVRHAVSGADYTSVRTSAFMGFRILAAIAGLDVQIAGGRAQFEHPRWGRYLANVTPSEWDAMAAQVPPSMRGDEFLRRYGGLSDSVTRVDPARAYALRAPTAHPILEHARVRTFADLLPRAHAPGVAARLGALMYESHASYSACGLGHPATDALVAAVRDAGPSAGLFGAKITGGGSGGTVAVFGHTAAEPVVRALAEQRLILGA